MNKIIQLVVILCVSTTAFAAKSLDYATYFSDEYGLSIPYPPSVFGAQGEVVKEGKGRGQLFVSKEFDAELVVSGYRTPLDIEQLFHKIGVTK